MVHEDQEYSDVVVVCFHQANKSEQSVSQIRRRFDTQD
jgi:hypothetical protein